MIYAELVGWLRAAEDYFHRSAVPAVASTCRALLRKCGAPVQQSRSGHDLVPRELRDAGVTEHEYEVFRLITEPSATKDIARRLHISPKTVEKHVASLLTKTRRPNRIALTEYAAVVVVVP